MNAFERNLIVTALNWWEVRRNLFAKQATGAEIDWPKAMTDLGKCEHNLMKAAGVVAANIPQPVNERKVGRWRAFR